MTSMNSVSAWIEDLQAGDQQAGQELFERYFKRLVGLARKKLSGAARRVADEEDVALSAFTSFFGAVERGACPQLSDRGDLWRLLVTITEHKAIDEIRRERSEKRGSGRVRGESVFWQPDEEGATGLAQVPGDVPSPQFVEQFTVQCRRLLDLLEGDDLREVALLRMEGLGSDEIAKRIERTRRTVQRRLKLIHDIWSAELL